MESSYRWITVAFIVGFSFLNIQSTIAQSLRHDTIFTEVINQSYLPGEDGKHWFVDVTSGYSLFGLLANHKKNGEWLTYYKKILQKKLNYLSGILDGPTIEYYSNGNPKAVYSYKNGSLEGAFIELYEDKNIKSYQFYHAGDLISERRVYSGNGLLQIEQLWPTLDSTNFNSAPCGDSWHSLGVMIDSATPFNGNSWYPDGKPDVICKNDSISPKIIHFKHYNSKGQIEITGSFKYNCIEDSCCWKEFGKWNWYKNEILIKEIER